MLKLVVHFICQAPGVLFLKSSQAFLAAFLFLLRWNDAMFWKFGLTTHLRAETGQGLWDGGYVSVW